MIYGNGWTYIAQKGVAYNPNANLYFGIREANILDSINGIRKTNYIPIEYMKTKYLKPSIKAERYSNTGKGTIMNKKYISLTLKYDVNDFFSFMLD